MYRQIAIITLGLAAVAGLNAGQIQIGGSSGLASTYTVAGQGGITATDPSAGTFGELTYAKTIAQGATAGSYTLPAIGSTLTSGGITYQMINDSANPTDSVWAGSNDGGTVGAPLTSTITIPIGIFGVTNVYTQLNDEYGVNNAINTTVQFNFGATGSSGSLLFNLVNGKVIADSFDCTGGSGLAACIAAGYATTIDTVNSYNQAGTVVVPSSSVASVSASSIYGTTYTTSAFTPYANTTGNIFLDAQNFYLGTFATPGTELYNIVISNTNTGLFKSRVELTAITVTTTPEPSTVFMGIAGLGFVAYFARRRKSLVDASKI